MSPYLVGLIVWWGGILLAAALLIAFVSWRDRRIAARLAKQPPAPVIEIGPRQAARERRRSCGRGGRIPAPVFDEAWHRRAIEHFERTGEWPA